ncbi:MAG: rhodanese-like domain-containing protein [Actinobacteria bacterium]|nr:MAG: rhodanese-like domain-containing protein [Actinomycetota bacterium]
MPVKVDRDQLQRLLEQRAQLVDVLPRDEYEEEHLPRAINLPLRRVETEATTALDPGSPIVVYCWDSA